MSVYLTPAEELEHLAGTRQRLEKALEEADDPRVRQLLEDGLRAANLRKYELEILIKEEQK